MVLLASWLSIGSRSALAVQPYEPVCGDPLLEPWRWRVFSELSGLGLQCMAEGSDQKLWFGVRDSVICYDGFQWTTYGTNDGLGGGAETLCAGPNGTLYAGGFRWGVSQFSQGQWRPLLPLTNQPVGFVRRLALTSDGSLWVASRNGLWRWRNSECVLYTGPEGMEAVRTNRPTPGFRAELLPQEILAKPRGSHAPGDRTAIWEVYADPQDKLWIGTENGEILRYEPEDAAGASGKSLLSAGPGRWTLYNESDGLVTFRLPRILQTADGLVWVVYAGSTGQANYFDGARWSHVRLADFGAPDDCNSLLQTRDGTLWFGCNGALCANRQGRWQVYEPPRVPIPAVRTFLLQTADGALWIGGQDAEVMRVDYQTRRWLTYQDLNFQWETPQGAQWFLRRDGRVVRHDTNGWVSYGAEDGLIDAPVVVLGTRRGEVWAAGSHVHDAATARFDGQTWQRQVHSQLSWGIDWRAAYESSTGALWFGAAVDWPHLGRGYSGGLLKFDQGQWVHYTVNSPLEAAPAGTNSGRAFNARSDPAGSFYGLGESRDGRIWGGQLATVCFDGRDWRIVSDTNGVRLGTIEAMLTTRERDLWVGSRQYGVLHYDGCRWQRFHSKDGLVANSIRSIAETTDGTIWVATDRGASRFDGRAWTSDVLPPELNLAREGGSLKTSPSGGLWVNLSSRNWNRRAWPSGPAFDPAKGAFSTVCYQLETSTPRTRIILGPAYVPRPGDLTVTWEGIDPWRATRDAELQYSYRLDGGPWSSFSFEKSHAFFGLPSGAHCFEVRARDRDFNVDPNPPRLEFEVAPPVWRQSWFICLMIALVSIIVAQTQRVIRHARHLARSNRALASEVEERKRIEREKEETHRQLVEASHQAGMAEVATSVLHNIGNVLNSVSVSAELIAEKVRGSKVVEVPKVARLLKEHAPEPGFLSEHPKGKMVPGYLESLGEHLVFERDEALGEVRALQQNVSHIKEIVAMQQQYSKLCGFVESVRLTELVEHALRLSETSLARHQIRLRRELLEDGAVMVEKHKVLQILVNLIRNAKQACDASGRPDPVVVVRTLRLPSDRVRVQVEDNGVGIAPENLTRIFSQGFTTRKDGHGFGLHSSVLAACELGGSLTVESRGPGLGACFTLELPTAPPS
jgi:signal transduction histidine kinase/ligand-binding sensor domain-containing protein